MNESIEGFCRRGRGRSFHVDGPKTEKAQEPTVESLVRGIWRLRVSEAERRVETRGCVKLKTVTEVRRSSARDTFIAESVYLVPNSFKQRCDVVTVTYEGNITVLYGVVGYTTK